MMARDWLPALLLVSLAAARPWLETRMWTHMGIELPLLFIAGACAARRVAGHRRTDAWNEQGIAGLTAASAIVMFWMLPLALDAAVLDPLAGLAKVASVFLAGALVAMSLPRAAMALQAFFILGASWMMAVAGLLYRQSPQRLCSSYLQDDQAHAGAALIVLAIAIIGTWLARMLRSSRTRDITAP